jgi:hypothetical protein
MGGGYIYCYTMASGRLHGQGCSFLLFILQAGLVTLVVFQYLQHSIYPLTGYLEANVT